MKLLVLGGTIFVGRHIVAAALNAGHSVTTLNRGTHKLEEQKDVERLIADRSSDLHILKNRTWDAVIDVSGYVPGVVEKSAKALANSVEQYIFISTVSVYKGFPTPGMTETATVKSIEGGDPVEYGSLKSACEQAVRKHFSSNSTIIRPGLVVGPQDPTDRFTYWPVRVAKGGRVLAPGAPDRRIQFIDARDLGRFTIHLAEQKTYGNFNATGPASPLTMREFLNECNALGGNSAQFVWASDEQLRKGDVTAWMEMPLWIPNSDKEHLYFLQIDCSQAMKAGLQFTPLSDTIKDTMAWHLSRGENVEWKAGIKTKKEKEVLTAISP